MVSVPGIGLDIYTFTGLCGPRMPDIRAIPPRAYVRQATSGTDFPCGADDPSF